MSLTFKPRAAEQRSISFQDVWGSSASAEPFTGDAITSGLRLIPVYSATSLISDMIATAPLGMYNTSADGARTLLPVQPKIVTDPSPYGSRIDWLHQCMTSLLLRGNAYGYVVALDAQGFPAKIIWLNPDAVTVIEEQNDWYHTPTYYWRGRELDIDLVVHIPAYTLAGSVKGLSPLSLFKLQIETGMRAQQFGDDWFKNGANPSGTLQNKARELDPTVADAAKSRFKAAVANRDVFVTGSDWTYSTLAVPGNESQFLETIKATATQIASIYRVSPEAIGGDSGSSLTYKTLSQDAALMNVRTLGPWAARLEWYLSNMRPRPQYAKFDLDALARGDRVNRMTSTAIALAAGIDTQDEARAAENKPPLTPDQVVFWQENYGKTLPATLAGATAPKAPTDPNGGAADGA